MRVEGKKHREDDDRNQREDAEQKQAAEEKRLRRELLDRQRAESGAVQGATGDPPRRSVNSPSSDDYD